jgi:hypothetical protein
MSTLRIDVTEDFAIEVSVRESDANTKSAYLKIERTSTEKNITVTDLFLTPEQLGRIGYFLMRQADEMKTMQEIRQKTSICQG